jgi:multiple sugar transport system permease protein
MSSVDVDAAPAIRAPRIRKPRKPPSPGRILGYAALILVALISLIPFLWMLSTSLKSLAETYVLPPKWIPSVLHFENYTSLWNDLPMNFWLFNSVKVAVLVTLGTLVTCSMAAYAFARINFPGRNLLFYAFIGTMMIPGMMYQVPKFALVRELGWYNHPSHAALIVPALSGAFGVFLLRQFFLTIPKELEEAARIDGAGHWTIFFRIILPLSGPALATLGVFTFIGIWNDFLNPLLFYDDINLYTLQTGLGFLNDAHSSTVNVNRKMAGDMIALIPMIVVFIAAQKYYVRGIALTGTKA